MTHRNGTIWQGGCLFLAGAVSTFVLGTFLAGCRAKPALTSEQLEGQQLYNVRCAHCHEYNDLALKKVPPNLHGVFDSPALPSGAPATDLNVVRTILSGKGMMPSFAGRFDQEQMDALISYLHAGIR